MTAETAGTYAKLNELQHRLEAIGVRDIKFAWAGARDQPLSHVEADVIHALEAYLDERTRPLQALGDSVRPAPMPVQTEVCPVCRTVHDKPLCPAPETTRELAASEAASFGKAFARSPRRVPEKTSEPRYLRPWVGTATMYAARMNFAVSDQWCQGFNACLNALDALGCATDSAPDVSGDA